jgi:hypothetical protein
MKRNNCRVSEVNGEKGLRPLQKVVLKTIVRYVNENKLAATFRGGISGEDFFTRFKRTLKLSLIKPPF